MADIGTTHTCMGIIYLENKMLIEERQYLQVNLMKELVVRTGNNQ